MQSALASLGHVGLTFDKYFDHLGYLFEAAKYDLVAFNKGVALVLDAGLLAKLFYENLQTAQIMAGYAREEMMASLELEAAVEEVEPLRAFDVHGCAELSLRESFGRAQVGRRHAPM
jgi:hypothetical protein